MDGENTLHILWTNADIHTSQLSVQYPVDVHVKRNANGVQKHLKICKRCNIGNKSTS